MAVILRRALLAGAGTLAAGTLAAATFMRKPGMRDPGQPEIIHVTEPAPEGAAKLLDLGALRLTEPPAPPPEATFTDADGAAHHLSDFAGRGLVVNLWATWCVPCVAELPALAALATRVSGEGILVMPLSSDRGGAAVVRKYYAAHGLEALPIWLDPHAEVAHAWSARGIPTTLIIDRHGNERARLEGGADWSSDAAVQRITELVK